MITLSDLMATARRRWLPAGILSIAVIAVALAFVLSQKPVYSSTAKGYVTVVSAANTSDLSLGAAFSRDLTQNLVDVAGTPLILGPVREQLGISSSLHDLGLRVTASVAPNSVVLEVTTRGDSPAKAAALSNAVMSQLRSSLSSLAPEARSPTAAIRLVQLQTGVASTSPANLNLTFVVAITLFGAVLVAFLFLYGVTLVGRLRLSVISISDGE